MQKFNAGYDHKGSDPFVIAYIDNPNLTDQEKMFSKNDFEFHNTLSHYAHSIVTIYAGTYEQAIKEAQELGEPHILCATQGLTNLDQYIQIIYNNNYTNLDNWQISFLRWINLSSDKTIEAPDEIVQNLDKSEQLEDFCVAENYYKIGTSFKKWYATNTEDTELTTPKEHTHEIYVTAGALTPAIEALNHFTRPGYIVIIDNSNTAHHMWDYIKENWNGKNYADFVRNFKNKYPALTRDFNADEDHRLQAYSDFFKTYEFTERWELVQKSKQIHYTKDILVNDPCYHIDMSTAPTGYVSMSNAYNFYPTAIYFNQDSRYEKFRTVEKCIEEKNKLICERTNEPYNIKFNERGMNGILRYRGRRP